MRRVVVLAATIVGCAVPFSPEVQREIDTMLVVPGDLQRPYDILGNVQFPGEDMMTLSGGCTRPALLKREAIEQYGSVDAIIGYQRWQDGNQVQCSGVAVRFR